MGAIMKRIVDVIVERDGMTVEDATNLVDNAVADFTDRLSEGEVPDNIFEEWFRFLK